ncbi:MAG TPA: ABC transporter substrate-binding protein [Pseudolabrys sp.]|nr:ABC transporter substrate-binding protein [Pseudolabrys sp.]
MPYTENDPAAGARIAALLSGLRAHGWIDGGNLRIEYRYAPKADAMKTGAVALVGQSPDVLLTTTNLATIALHRETRTIPIIFVGGGDMIKEGLVSSLARPGGNVTGFTNFEPAMGGKWLQLLKEMAPALRRVGFLHNPDTAANINDMHFADAAARPLNVDVVPLPTRNRDDIERAVREFAAASDAGIVVAPNPTTIGNHSLVVDLANAHHLPAVYPLDFYATEGGLMSYGPDQLDMFKRGAAYVDQILKGTSAGSLPVQAPTKFELVINQKTAKSMAIVVPSSLLARADEVIE